MEKKFNLLYEPWIRIMDNNLEVKEKSLIEVLENANEIKSLAGDSPLQDISIERLLLAIAITVFYRYDENGNEKVINDADIDFEDEDDVEELVMDRFRSYLALGKFPDGVIKEYLEKYSERFWLIHPETPFYQVPELKDVKQGFNAMKMLSGCIKDSNNVDSRRLFEAEDGDVVNAMDFAEKARWLVYLQNYSVTVKKPGNKTGRLGQLGLVKINGNNLFEELMLNLCPVDLVSSSPQLWGTPSPVWEQKQKTFGKVEIPFPDNLPELYTLQSKGILLFTKNPKKAKEEGFTMTAGDTLPEDEDPIEQMSLWWIRDEKNPQIIPKRHSPGISAWREFPTLLHNGDVRPTGVISWFNFLIRKGLIPQRLMTVSFYGIQYDDKGYKYVETIYDSLNMSSELLEEAGKNWIIKINDEIEKCESVGNKIFYAFAVEMAEVFGKETKGREAINKNVVPLKEKLSAKFFGRIDGKFRKWLQSIEPGISDVDSKQKEWETIARKTADGIIKDYISDLSDISVSREQDGKTLSIPVIYAQFRNRLFGKYPLEKNNEKKNTDI